MEITEIIRLVSEVVVAIYALYTYFKNKTLKTDLKEADEVLLIQKEEYDKISKRFINELNAAQLTIDNLRNNFNSEKQIEVVKPKRTRKK